MGESLQGDHNQDKLNPGFAALARWILSHRLLTSLLVLGVAAAGVVLIGTLGLKVDNRPEVFAAKDAESVLALEQVRSEFGRDDLFVILVEGDVFTTPFLQQLKSLEDAIAAIDIPTEPSVTDPSDDAEDEWGAEEGGSIVSQTTSLFTARETRPSADGIVVGTPLDTWPNLGDLNQLKQSLISNPQYAGRLLDTEGRHTTIIVQIDTMDAKQTAAVHKRIAELVEPYRSETFKIWLAGLPSLETTLNELNMSDTERLTLLSVVLILFFLAYLFRHPIGIMGPLLVIVFATLMSISFMSAMGYTMNILTTILPAFLVIVCVGDSVHLQSVYRDVRRRGVDNDEAIVCAVGMTAMPMLFTTLTTAIGLLAFRMATLDPVRELGSSGAFGVCGAFFVTIFLLPVTLSWNRKGTLGAKDPSERSDFLDAVLVFCNRLSGTSRKPLSGAVSTPKESSTRLRITLVLGGLVVAGSVYSAQLIQISHDPLNWLTDDMEVKRGFNRMDKTVGGTANIVLLATPTSKSGLRDLDFMKRLETLEQRILGYEHAGRSTPLVTSAVSVLDIIRETNQALHGGDKDYYRLPDTERGLGDVLFLFENAGPQQLRRLATTDLSRTQVQFNIHWLPATQYQPLAEFVNRNIKELFPVAGEVKATGAVYSLLSTIGLLVQDLARSFGFAFAVITVMMILLFGNLKLGLLAMVPNLAPIMGLLSVMVWGGVPLDMSTLMVFSIAIGICVDDTIHLLHHFKVHYDATGHTEDAIKKALKHGGRAIVITSIVLIAGMGCQMFAQMASISRFGMLVAVTIGLALLADLVLAPAVLRLFYPMKAKGE